MLIVSSSVLPTTEMFLHPGYEAVHGEWTFPLRAIPYNKKPSVHMDFSAALELDADPLPLTNEAPSPPPALSAPAAATQRLPEHAPIPPATSPWPAVAVSVALVMSAVAAIPKRRGSGRRWYMRIALAGFCAVGAVAVPLWATRHKANDRLAVDPTRALASASEQAPMASASASQAVPSNAPGPMRPPFRRPREATLAILHGLIADAIGNSVEAAGESQTARFSSLAEVRAEVGLPTKSPTPGMAYALEHYDQDGWGRPFRIAYVPEPDDGSHWHPPAGEYAVSSAGADGDFDTADDIKLEVRAMYPRDPAWDRRRHAFFVGQISKDDVTLLYHRDPERSDWYRRPARAITGNELYNALVITKIQGNARLQGIKKLATEVDGEMSDRPLVMLVYWPGDFISVDRGGAYTP